MQGAFTKPPLKSQSKKRSGVEIRQAFVAEDIHMFSPENAATSNLKY